MPILVNCECGHEITVADTMQGKKGRCPKCDTVLSIPATEPSPSRSRARRSGVFAPLPGSAKGPPQGSLSSLAGLLSAAALLCLLSFSFVGVYAGVTALMSPEDFAGPFGFLGEYADEVAESPTLMGAAFIVGGIAAGALLFLLLSASSQLLRLFISLERSLAEITRSTTRRD